METIKHENYTEVKFNVNYNCDEFHITITDSNDHKENMMLFLGNETISWSVQFSERASQSMRRVLASHNTTLLYTLIKGQISKKERNNFM